MSQGKAKKFSISRMVVYIFLTLASFLSLFLFCWMFVLATRPSASYNSIPPTITLGNMLVENFKKVLQQIDFFGAMWNSFVLCTIVTIVVLFISSLAGFAFAKFKFPGKNALFVAIMLTMIIPPQLGLIPQYLTIAKAGLLDTLQGVRSEERRAGKECRYRRQLS